MPVGLRSMAIALVIKGMVSKIPPLSMAGIQYKVRKKISQFRRVAHNLHLARERFVHPSFQSDRYTEKVTENILRSWSAILLFFTHTRQVFSEYTIKKDLCHALLAKFC